MTRVVMPASGYRTCSSLNKMLEEILAVVLIINASWYSVESLKKEKTFNRTKGVMANGKVFSNSNFTCGTNLFPLGAVLSVTNLSNGKEIRVRVTDRLARRFTNKRIDLSKAAFARIADLKTGVVKVKVVQLAIKRGEQDARRK